MTCVWFLFLVVNRWCASVCGATPSRGKSNGLSASPFMFVLLIWTDWEAEAATWEARLHAMQTGENQARVLFAPDSGVCRPLWDGTGACSGPPVLAFKRGCAAPSRWWDGSALVRAFCPPRERGGILLDFGFFFLLFSPVCALSPPTYPCSPSVGSARLVYRWRVARPRRWQLL